MNNGPNPTNSPQPTPIDAEVVQPVGRSGYQTPPPNMPPYSGFPPPRRRRSIFGVLFIFMLLLALGISLLANMALVGGNVFSADAEQRVKEKHFSHQRYGKNKIAILSVEGTILEGSGFVKHQIDKAMEDESVKAIVLRVNSPGGTITGSDYILHHFRELAEQRDIPIVVSMGAIAASGGYYVSMAVGDTPEAIFAEPTTWTGSIGVVIPHYDLSKLLADWGIQQDSIASHRLKTMGSFAKPMSEEERKIFQSLVDDSFTRFKDVIKESRPKFNADPQALDKLATGQIFNAEQAVANGLVDKVGFIEDAVDRAIALAKLDPEDVAVVKYERELSLASLLMGGSGETGKIDLATILDIATPRAFYLCTWLPANVSSR